MAEDFETEMKDEFAAMSARVRAAVQPLFASGGLNSIIANTIHAAVMAMAPHPATPESETPRDETGDSIDPHSGALLNKPAPQPVDETTAKLEADRIAALPPGKFGVPVEDGALAPAAETPEGAMVVAPAHPTSFGPPPVDPTQPPKSENDPKGPFDLQRDDGPGAGLSVGGDAGKVQPNDFDAAAIGGDMRSADQKAADTRTEEQKADDTAKNDPVMADGYSVAPVPPAPPPVDHTALDEPALI